MAGKDIVMLSGKELKRLKIIQAIIDRKMMQTEGGKILGLTARQIRRIINRVKLEGDKGLCHRARGKHSNRRKSAELRDIVIKLHQEKYSGFGPTLMAEKLGELDNINISDETLRLWFKDSGIPYNTRKNRPHRQWRERRGHFGELVQMDGSHHDWFEGRGSKCVLMGYIDDASGNVFGRFYEYEGTIPAMDSIKRYAELYGYPVSLYSDKHTTYKSTAKATIEDELNGDNHHMSQFERAMKELGVEVIHAHSPQAKGRIERLFGTLQDRLVKEMRLAGIKSINEANVFLESFLPVYNKRFRVLPANAADLHRPASNIKGIEHILCIKNKRVLRNDYTITYNGKLYQIKDSVRAKKVGIEERLDGTMHVMVQGISVGYKEITSRPIREIEKIHSILTKTTKLSPEHPWKKYDFKYGKKAKEQKSSIP